MCLFVIWVNHTHRYPTASESHTGTDGIIWHVLAPWLKCTALTCSSPIRACSDADYTSLLETRHRWLWEGDWGPHYWYGNTVVVPWQDGRNLQPKGGYSSALLFTLLWLDGVNQSSPKMSASAQVISDWNIWQMGMLFPLFNQFHQMWFYLL